MKLVKVSCLILFFTLLVGCAGFPLSVTSVSPETPTDLSPSPTPEIDATSVSKGFEIRPLCPEVDVATSGDFSKLTGTIILAGDNISLYHENFSPDNSQTAILLFWNTGSGKGTIYPLPGQQFSYYLTSPDRTKLALTEGKTLSMPSEVLILTAEAQQKASLTLPDDWTLFDWLNDEKLLVRQIRLQGEDLELVAIDPITGEQEFLPSDFPNLYSNDTLFFWGALTIFDPTESLVVYPERKEDTLISVVWDLRAEREIANIVGGEWPQWSPIGNRLLIVADQDAQLHRRFNEIFIVTPKGEVTRSTFFKDNFENSSINTPVWSPNGRYIALWLSTSLPVKTARLGVLDTETSTIDLYCKEIDPFPYRMGENNTLGYAYYQVNSAPPIWSPDSKYLLIENYQDFKSSTFLFDLRSHSITKIADNARPVGWLE